MRRQLGSAACLLSNAWIELPGLTAMHVFPNRRKCDGQNSIRSSLLVVSHPIRMAIIIPPLDICYDPLFMMHPSTNNSGNLYYPYICHPNIPFYHLAVNLNFRRLSLLRPAFSPSSSPPTSPSVTVPPPMWAPPPKRRLAKPVFVAGQLASWFGIEHHCTADTLLNS